MRRSVWFLALVLLCVSAGVAHAEDVPTATYDGFGYAFAMHGSLFAIERRGLAHVDPSGRITLFRFDGTWQPRTIYDSVYDDRGVGGGVTPLGRIVAFFGRYDAVDRHWVDMGLISSNDLGETWSDYATVETFGNTTYLPYGPMVTLPSGSLMQTFYGNDGSTCEVWALFSHDDGKTWGERSLLVRSATYCATEAAAAFVSGADDAHARLVAVVRTGPAGGSKSSVGLLQATSADGGRTWRVAGRPRFSTKASDVSPWISALPNGRLELAWASRSTMTLRHSVVTGYAAWKSFKAWPAPIVDYSSRLSYITDSNKGDFGYPSIATVGNERFAVIYDHADPAGASLERVKII